MDCMTAINAMCCNVPWSPATRRVHGLSHYSIKGGTRIVSPPCEDRILYRINSIGQEGAVGGPVALCRASSGSVNMKKW